MHTVTNLRGICFPAKMQSPSEERILLHEICCPSAYFVYKLSLWCLKEYSGAFIMDETKTK